MAQQNKGGFGVAHPVRYSPEPEDQLDTNPSDKQPPGVDEEIDYNSLEDALTS
tara:strand:- start:39 stop:197 length:159 start_codon:yes stop_codon:yes gene_type:complete